jgi:hypothetical protein
MELVHIFAGLGIRSWIMASATPGTMKRRITRPHHQIFIPNTINNPETCPQAVGNGHDMTRLSTSRWSPYCHPCWQNRGCAISTAKGRPTIINNLLYNLN